jgi:predicted NBD/HSP70 family sugar kinase
VYDGEPCRCGARGCLEAYVGADAIGRSLASATGAPYAPDLLSRMLAAEPMPPPAAEVFARAVGHLGAGIGDLINLFGPERIVLGGVAGAQIGRRFLPEIREAVARHALRGPFAQTGIDLCALGPEAVAMGAATLPIARLLADGGVTRQLAQR